MSRRNFLAAGTATLAAAGLLGASAQSKAFAA